MRMPAVTGRIVYRIAKPFLGLILSGKLRARALLIHESQILLVRNWMGKQKWALPGGGVKTKESPQEAEVRELKEELDLDVEETNLEYITKLDFVEGNIRYPVVIYRLDLSSKPLISMRHPELIGAQWFDINSLPMDIDELAEKIIKQQR